MPFSTQNLQLVKLLFCVFIRLERRLNKRVHLLCRIPLLRLLHAERRDFHLSVKVALKSFYSSHWPENLRSEAVRACESSSI